MKSVIAFVISFLALQHLQAQKNDASSTSIEKWQVTDDNLEYKIIQRNTGKPIRYGNYMQLQVKQVYSGNTDTILMDTRKTCPTIQLFDSTSVPQPYYNIVRQLKTGDSLTIRMLTEHAFKDTWSTMPAFMEKGKYLYTGIILLNIFESAQLADSADKAEKKIAKPRIYANMIAAIENEIAGNKNKIEADGKLIEAVLLKKNIKASKTSWGTYITVIKEGTGRQIDNNCLVTINYTGKIMKTGKIIDSNTMPSFHHVVPYEIDISEPTTVILGLYDGLLRLKKGTWARLYIPSPLAYGSNGMEPLVKPDEILVFEVKVLTVKEIK
jgi:FKBP-type peptidyl-prolyl cis-trans isomerase FkpA